MFAHDKNYLPDLDFGFKSEVLVVTERDGSPASFVWLQLFPALLFTNNTSKDLIFECNCKH